MTHGVHIPLTRAEILSALNSNQGSIRASARALGVHPSTLVDHLRRHNLLNEAARLRWVAEGKRLLG